MHIGVGVEEMNEIHLRIIQHLVLYDMIVAVGEAAVVPIAKQLQKSSPLSAICRLIVSTEPSCESASPT